MTIYILFYFIAWSDHLYFVLIRSDHLYFVFNPVWPFIFCFHPAWPFLCNFISLLGLTIYVWFYVFAWSDHFWWVFDPDSLSSSFYVLSFIPKPIVSKLTDKLEDILVEMVDKVLKILRGVIGYLWLWRLDSTGDCYGTSSSHEFIMCLVSN